MWLIIPLKKKFSQIEMWSRSQFLLPVHCFYLINNIRSQQSGRMWKLRTLSFIILTALKNEYANISLYFFNVTGFNLAQCRMYSRVGTAQDRNDYKVTQNTIRIEFMTFLNFLKNIFIRSDCGLSLKNWFLGLVPRVHYLNS